MGIPKYWKGNPDSHTEISVFFWFGNTEILGKSVWDIFGLGSVFFWFGLGILGIFSTPNNMGQSQLIFSTKQ